eukprot:scaffold14224_cov96-Isochrysis_galbana.AAC.5
MSEHAAQAGLDYFWRERAARQRLDDFWVSERAAQPGLDYSGWENALRIGGSSIFRSAPLRLLSFPSTQTERREA